MPIPTYFPPACGAASPLTATVTRPVRFEEVDALGIVWHGRYASYFEDARVALGDKYGVGYLDIYHRSISAPIKQMRVDYMLPLTFGETVTVEATLHWTEAARLNYSYIIRNGRGEVATTGCTVQLFLDPQGQLQVCQPEFIADFMTRWKRGELAR
ncbi:MAG: acyl-CoA thioesterase [Proteobacteria bacterium]|nr:acyl-CoA thioesterase [Pseudomonadota bacterium]MBU1595068.1 acyl-CoA thioesterase [Pseudomonadota bacterium]